MRQKNLVANNDIEKVSVRWPDLNDFNDMLTQGCEARERVFIRKQREAAMKLENALKNFHPKSPTFGNVAGCTSLTE